jgi:hypothetical protein
MSLLVLAVGKIENSHRKRAPAEARSRWGLGASGMVAPPIILSVGRRLATFEELARPNPDAALLPTQADLDSAQIGPLGN